jgi:hypothetical protein
MGDRFKSQAQALWEERSPEMHELRQPDCLYWHAEVRSCTLLPDLADLGVSAFCAALLGLS